MDIEHLIRGAQEWQAEQAVPAGRIGALLPARVARARRRRWMLVGAGVAAVVIVAGTVIPGLVRSGPGPAVPPVASIPRASASPVVVRRGLSNVPLGYRPTWLPPGFTERIRSAGPGDPDAAFGPALIRVWKKQATMGDPFGGTELTLAVNTAMLDPARTMGTDGLPVDIAGLPGRYSSERGDHRSSVIWSPEMHTTLTLTATDLDLPETDLLRIARNVRPEAGVFAAPLRLRWLPAGWSDWAATVSGPSTAAWRGQILASPSPAAPSSWTPETAGRTNPAVDTGTVVLTVGGVSEAPAGGTELTVGGRPARHLTDTDQAGARRAYLVVDLGSGRLMTLVGVGVGLDVLSKVAERTEITSAATDWLGS
jgi:hypothetical protein